MEVNTCHCGKEPTKRQTKKPGSNLNRWFYVCASRRCNYFKWIGQRCVDATLYDTRMAKMQRQEDQALGGSGVINAIRDRSTTIKFYVHSIDSIGITLGDNSHSLLESIKQLPDILFDEPNQVWILPATYSHYVQAYETLLRSPFYQHIKCTPLTDQVISLLERGPDPLPNLNLLEERINSHVKNHSIWNHRMDYQQQGVRECLVKGGRILLADEMGLGKTIQALAIALAYSDSWPVLIICPSSLLFTWSEQIQRWLHPLVSNQDIRLTLKGSELFGYTPNQVLPILTDPSSDQDNAVVPHIMPPLVNESQKASFNIISYDLAVKHCDTLCDMGFQLIICDESHNLKNPKTKRTMALTKLLHQADRVLLLTGTPILSRPIELYPQLFILQPDLFPNMCAFGLEYCAGFKMKYGWNYTGSSNSVQLHFILERSVMVRRLKSQVQLSLPSKVRQTVWLDIVDLEKKEYLAELDDEREESEERSYTGLPQKALSIAWYKATGTAKIPSIITYLRQLLTTTNDQILLFAYHKDVMDAMEKLAKDLKVESIRIDGTTKPTLRHTLCQRFQKGAVAIAILSITACQVGLNFQAASTVVFAELYWNPGHVLQAEDRAHRMGQTKTVHVKYLVAKDSADDQWLWPMLSSKFKVVHQVLD